MARLVPPALVIVLLAATAAAFAITEGLKLTPSPILDTQVGKTFSPVCHCPTARVEIRFRLRRADTLTIVVVDGSDRIVRTLVTAKRFGRGRHHFVWNGRDDAGALASDGVYEPRVHLAAEHRTILLPNAIALDTKPPTAKLTIRRRTITPGTSKVKAVYKLSEPAIPQLLVDGKTVLRGRFSAPTGKLDWYGTGFAAGTYRVALRGIDLAGNVGPATPGVTVRILYLELASHSLRVAAGGTLRVSYTPAEAVRWRLAGRTGVARKGRLAIAAPALPGAYTLYVVVGAHADRARVVVTP